MPRGQLAFDMLLGDLQQTQDRVVSLRFATVDLGWKEAGATWLKSFRLASLARSCVIKPRPPKGIPRQAANR